MKSLRWVFLALVLTGCQSPKAPLSPTPTAIADPVLTVKSAELTHTFTRAQLLKTGQDLKLEDKAAYEHQSFNYRVVPVATLFAGMHVPKGRQLHYETTDGFSSSVSADLALNQDPKGAVAYVAVEPPDLPWPKLEKRTETAGPFYLVWSHPELSKIGREEWPFQIKELSIQASPESLYPATLPSASLPRTGQEWRGYQVFTKNCFPCHTMNGQGAAHFGPDLGAPMNPTEYFQEAALRKLIRNPRSVRTWNDSKMSAFPESVISNPDLDDLLAYLRQMAKQKKS